MSETGRQLPRTAAEVHPVREVTLLGEADHAPFAQLLEQDALRPIEVSGKARLFASATDTRFHGIRFREFSVSVLVENQRPDADEPAAFLLQAFNSVRFFAWIERTVFSTPYRHAKIAVKAAFPAEVKVAHRGITLAALRMSGSKSRPTLRQGAEHWDGVVHLPTRSGKRAPADAKMFFASLLGDARVYACAPDDEIRFTEHPDYPIFQRLNEANFQGLEWLLREHGRHRKTRTVARGWRPNNSKV